MNSTEKLIQEAADRLSEHIHDSAHDVEHHSDVCQSAVAIAKHLQIPIDLDALQIAAMWHDVSTPGLKGSESSADLAVTAMNRLELQADAVEKVRIAIQFHEYDKTPQNTEGEVLYDADKLSILNIDRWVGVIESVESGATTYEYARDMFLTVFKWAPTLKAKMHFPYTKSLVDQMYAKLVSDPRSEEIASKFKLEITNLQV